MIISNDSHIADILRNTKTVAVVGHSDKPHRTSYQIAQFLRQVGYTVFAVNPTVDEIDGEPAYASLADLPQQVDIVNVFRQADHLEGVVQEVADLDYKPTVVWGQLGVKSDAAAAVAATAELQLIMDRCIKIEYARLLR